MFRKKKAFSYFTSYLYTSNPPNFAVYWHEIPTSALFLLMQVLQYDTFCGNVIMVCSHCHVQYLVVAAFCRNVNYLTFHPGDWEETMISCFAAGVSDLTWFACIHIMYQLSLLRQENPMFSCCLHFLKNIILFKPPCHAVVTDMSEIAVSHQHPHGLVYFSLHLWEIVFVKSDSVHIRMIFSNTF